MKKLNKIKLTVLNRNEIADKEQRLLKGGADYNCGCISGCVDDLCACLEDGGYQPKETVLSSLTTTINSEEDRDKLRDEKLRDSNL